MRGRALLWLLLLLVGAAAAWWYFAPQTLPALVRRQLPAPPHNNPPLYEWHDAKGQLHVTDTPPQDRPYKTFRYNPNVNVIPSNPNRTGKKPD